jgi:predicted dehydrogenase
MFQSRCAPGYRKAKELIDSGELGPMLRVTCLETKWYRSQTYYDSGGWRATWSGEGGGVLLNQCPHTLDIFTWLAGMPKRLFAMCKLGGRHGIEVEDEVAAVMEFENGAFGQFITSSGEAPGSSVLEIAFDRGLLRANSNRLQFIRNRVTVREHLKTSAERFGKPEAWEIDVPVPKAYGGNVHQPITQSFVNAILKGGKQIAPGVEGIKGLELGNAMLLSGLKGTAVDLPLDPDEMEGFIQDLCRKSSFVKSKVVKAKDDIAASYHE